MSAPPDAVKSLFFAALDVAPPARAAFLDTACRGDDDLRGRVAALLRAAEADDPLLDRPAAWHLDLSATPLPEDQLQGCDPGQLTGPEVTEAGRFRLLGEIARGGMGVVLRAHDPEMDRAVAVKVVLPRYRGDPAMARRFLGEARLAGQLQHPGVVPVHEVGRLADGRPFFAMKLIEGRTLAQLLRERPDPGHDRPRFLRYFEAVCQAIGYAHSKGVIHRDLKPSNVMVGSFGEVQVMDWGLAKSLPEDGERREAEAAPDAGSTFRRPPSASPETLPGHVLGTPAYTAPEQAAGRAELLDERSDVFGLGAILCEVLTGHPPYVGTDPLQVHRRAARADLADAHARLRGCGADAELIDLAVACLAAEPAGRPADGRAVAAALTAHLDGVQARLRQAEVAEAAARAHAAGEVKRRRLATALAGTVLLTVGLGTAAALWLQADRQARQVQRQARQNEVAAEVTEALHQVAALREKARTDPDAPALFARAREHAQRALALVQGGPAEAALAAQVRRVKGELDEEEDDRSFVAAIDAARLAQAETLPEQGKFAAARAVPLFREAFRVYGLPVGDGEPAAAAARLRSRTPLVREAASAALDEWIGLALNHPSRVAEPHLDWLRALARAMPDQDLAREMHTAWQERDVNTRRGALEKLAREADVRKFPPHVLTRLASRLRATQAPTSAVQLLRRTHQQYPADFWVNSTLGEMLTETEPRRGTAVPYLTAAVALRPTSAGVRVNLGVALEKAGHSDEAVACFEKAIALDPKYAAAHYHLGGSLKAKGKLDDAIACYQKAIALSPKHPFPHKALANTFLARGNLDAAVAGFQKAIGLDPTDPTDHNTLGYGLANLGRTTEAVACYQKAIALDPKFADAHNNLGTALKAMGKAKDAVACFEQAIALDPKLAIARYNLGNSLRETGQLDKAIACYEQAIALDPKHAQTHANLGMALSARGKVDEAIACYRRAVALDPNLAPAHYNLGNALNARGRVDEAVACFRNVIRLVPAFAEAHCNLGHALLRQGEFAEALPSFRRGHDLGRQRGGWRYPSAQWVTECEELIDREKRLLAVLGGKAVPATGKERLEWAAFCAWTRRYAGATRLWGEAFAAEPKLADDLAAGHRYQAARAAVRAAAGQGRDAGGLDAAAKARLRQQALAWLKADLSALGTRPPADNRAEAGMLRQWQSDEALAAVRGEVLRALPAAEGTAWGTIWSEVEKRLSDEGRPLNGASKP